MGATSVTGKGLGSAVRKNAGWKDFTVAANRVIGPRIMYADRVTLDSSGDLSLVLPAFSGSATDYIVQVTDANASAAAACAASVALSATATTVTLKGPASSAVYVTITKKGLSI
jgi:hypothetical protein